MSCLATDGEVGQALPPANPVGSDTKSAKTLLHYALPYWRRLVLVLVLSLLSTALSLVLPYLSKALIDRGLLGRDTHALVVIVALFAGITLVSFLLNVVSGLRYTGTSAQILFDMRLSL